MQSSASTQTRAGKSLFMFTVNYKPGSHVFRKGDQADVAYVIESGAVEISLPDEGEGKRVLGILGPGEVFGEMGPIDGHPRSADALILQDTTLLVIDHNQIDRRLEDSDPFIVGLFKTISKRLRDTYGNHVDDDQEDQWRQQQVIAELKVEKLIREGVIEDQFIPFFQPIVSLRDNDRIVGFEALVRWAQPHGRFVTPDRFMPLAERCGFVRDIDLAMIDKGCRALKDNLKHPEDYFIAFNLSASHFGNDHIVEEVAAVIKKYDFPPSSIKIEITESALIKYSETAKKVLNSIKEMGAKVAIDDFGTGYSSLSYLHDYPIDVMKIDRSFVSNMIDNRKGQSIIDAMIALSLSLNMTVLAEGIETDEQREMLRSKKVHLGQGWNFWKAMPMDEALALVGRAPIMS